MIVRCLYVTDETGVCTNCGRRPIDNECVRTGEPVNRSRSVDLNLALRSMGAQIDRHLAPAMAKLNAMFDRRGKP